MKKLVTFAMIALLAGFCGIAYAGTQATQTFNCTVSEINEIAVSGNPGDMTISAAVAGAAPTAVTDATTNYDVTTNAASKKIAGKIDAVLSTGVTLSVTLASTAGVSAGKQALGVADTDLVTGLAKEVDNDQTITYELSATAAAGVCASDAVIVTFTISTP